jgi:hypothetical protein
MRVSSLSFSAGVLFLIAGMIWGIIMAIVDNHVTMPAHAHFELLGWVSLFLIGTYYRLNPAVEHSRSATLQVWTWIAGTLVLAAGVALVWTGHSGGDPIAAIGSFIVLFAAVWFGCIVYRREGAQEPTSAAGLSPAE